MNELAAELPAAGVVRVVGPEEAGAGFLVSASGLIVTCAHVLAGCAPGATVSIEPHVDRRSLAATVELLQDPPDVAVLRLTAPVPPEVVVLPLGRSPRTPQPGLRTFGYPQMRPEAGLPGELAFYGVTAAAGYDQLALRSEEATLGFSGAPIWDPQLGAVVGMVKSIARGDPGQRLGSTAIGVPAEVIRDLCPELRLPAGLPLPRPGPVYRGARRLLLRPGARDQPAAGQPGRPRLRAGGRGLRRRQVLAAASRAGQGPAGPAGGRASPADPLLPAGQQPAARRTAPEPGPARDTPSPGASRGPCSGAGRGDSRRRSSRRTDRGGRPVRAALHRLRGRRAETVRRVVAVPGHRHGEGGDRAARRLLPPGAGRSG